MKIINALACAGLSRLPDGEWTRHSCFSQAINYRHPAGALLTFFRYGKGMGPAGILLTRRQFAECCSVTHFIKEGERIKAQGMMIRSRRVLRLQPTVGEIRQQEFHYSPFSGGLCGTLNQPLSAMPYFQELTSELERWHEGESPDWRWLIGRGPGLTPSGDDMLVGVLAILFASGVALSPCSFLPPADQLARLTTSVSCSYLNSARHGEFSTPVLRLLRRLQSARSPHFPIQRLLGVGHTSGADTLLGMAMAQQWLRVMSTRRMHARSGNNTHVYSGG